MTGDAFRNTNNHEVDTATGIGSNLDETQGMISRDLEGSRFIEYKVKNISNFDILSDSAKKLES